MTGKNRQKVPLGTADRDGLFLRLGRQRRRPEAVPGPQDTGQWAGTAVVPARSVTGRLGVGRWPVGRFRRLRWRRQAVRGQEVHALLLFILKVNTGTGIYFKSKYR